MKILIYPTQIEDPGVEISVPENYKDSILSWTTVSCRRYNFGSILTQFYSYKYYRIYIYRFTVHTPVKLFPFCDKGIIALQFTLKGQIIAKLIGFGQIKLDAKRWLMLYLPQGSSEAVLNVGETISLHIEFEYPYLDELVDGNEEIARLKQLHENADISAEVLPQAYIDKRAEEALMAIMETNETPGELPVELKTYIVTLLNLYRKSIKETEEFRLLPDVPHKELLIDFAKQIRAAPAHKYNFNALAKKHGVYYKTLARSFKDLTGLTLKLYVYEQRMHRAFSLVKNSQLSFNEIASELGYVEPNNLHRAFVKRFGKTLLEVRSTARTSLSS
jgi:AraC-like DNA-binding protein